MRRLCSLLLSLALCLSLLSGCVQVEPQPPAPDLPPITEPEDRPQQPDPPPQPPRPPTPPPVEDPLLEEARHRVSGAIRQSIEAIRRDPQRQASRVTVPFDYRALGYESLNALEKSCYRRILEAAENFQPLRFDAAEEGYHTLDAALTALGAVYDDRPDLECYCFLKDVDQGSRTVALELIYFLPGDSQMRPLTNTEGLRQEMKIFDLMAQEIVRHMPPELSTYDKYRYLALVISHMTDYDHEFRAGWQTTTVYGAINGPLAICQGYAVGYRYLCSKANLFCQVVTGLGADGLTGHAWNLVALEEGSYHVDVTWCDSADPGSPDWFRWFLLTQRQILTDHTIQDGTVATGRVGYPCPVHSVRQQPVPIVPNAPGVPVG